MPIPMFPFERNLILSFPAVEIENEPVSSVCNTVPLPLFAEAPASPNLIQLCPLPPLSILPPILKLPAFPGEPTPINSPVSFTSAI